MGRHDWFIRESHDGSWEVNFAQPRKAFQPAIIRLLNGISIGEFSYGFQWDSITKKKGNSEVLHVTDRVVVLCDFSIDRSIFFTSGFVGLISSMYTF